MFNLRELSGGKMLILTNCLTKTADEGAVKLAASLVKRIKKTLKNCKVISYDKTNELADENISLNKFFIGGDLKKLDKNEDVLFIPFPARPWANALRIFNLSLRFKKQLSVIMTMTTEADFLTRLFLKKSKARLIVFSKNAENFYSQIVGAKRVKHLKTGVDTRKFVPADNEKIRELKIKYNFDPDKKIILHVGHLNRGRNIEHLKKFSNDYSVLLVTSTLTKNEQDIELKKDLLSCENIRIIDDFIPDIEEIYQMSDVYFFPVIESGRCIDIPLSCMEAAACNKPIITTCFGAMKEFMGKDGFYFTESFDADKLNELVKKACDSKAETRKSVMEYDWNNTVSYLEKIGE